MKKMKKKKISSNHNKAKQCQAKKRTFFQHA